MWVPLWISRKNCMKISSSVVKMKVAQSCPTLCNPWTMNSLGQNTGMDSLSLLQGILPTQGSNPGLLHCRHILHCLSHKGSPRILEWVAYPFSRGSSWPRNRTRVSCIAGGFFTNWAIREAKGICSLCFISAAMKSRPCSLQLEKVHMQQRKPSTAINK